MNKFTLISLAPLFISNFGVLYKNNSSTIRYEVMENGDYSLLGYGSVTDELEKSGKFVIDDYKLGKKNNNQLLLVSESSENMYLYAYFINPDDLFRYDKVSMKIWEAGDGETLADYNDDVDGSWVDLNITPVSFDETKTLVKYKIEDLYVNNDLDHMYIFREIYDDSNKNNYDYVLKAGLIYNYSSQRDFISVSSEETVSIKNKLVGYQIMPFTTSDDKQKLYQRSFVGFSIDDTPAGESIEDLIDVTLSYKANYFGGYTDIPLNYNAEGTLGFWWNLAYDFDSAVGQINLYNHMDKSILYKEYSENVVKTISHDPLKITYHENDNSGWFGSRWNQVDFTNSGDDLTYDAIESIDNIDEEILSRNNDLSNCDWFVSFDNREIGCGTFMDHFDSGFYGYERSVGNLFVGVTPVNTGIAYTDDYDITFEMASSEFTFGDSSNDYENMLLFAKDVTVLNLTYKNDIGLERNVLAVDTYSDSVGQVDIKDDTTSSDWDEFVNNIGNWFANIGSGINNYWNVIKWVFLGVSGIVLIIFIVYLIKFLNLFFRSYKASYKSNNDDFKKKKKK